jgi:hypothetical protein
MAARGPFASSASEQPKNEKSAYHKNDYADLVPYRQRHPFTYDDLRQDQQRNDGSHDDADAPEGIGGLHDADHDPKSGQNERGDCK